MIPLITTNIILFKYTTNIILYMFISIFIMSLFKGQQEHSDFQCLILIYTTFGCIIEINQNAEMHCGLDDFFMNLICVETSYNILALSNATKSIN